MFALSNSIVAENKQLTEDRKSVGIMSSCQDRPLLTTATSANDANWKPTGGVTGARESMSAYLASDDLHNEKQREKDSMTLTKRIALTGLALAASIGVATAQAPEGRLYVFHSKATGACPSLDWHVMVGADGALMGMIAWNDMKDMAKATGTLNTSAKTFTMTATEVGGQGRTATVDGKLRSDGWLIANVKGPKIDCKGITIPWYTPPAGAGNG